MKQKYTYKINRNSAIIEIRIWDQSRKLILKRKCNIYDRASLADILYTLKAFGIDCSTLMKSFEEEVEEERKQLEKGWFKDF